MYSSNVFADIDLPRKTVEFANLFVNNIFGGSCRKEELEGEGEEKRRFQVTIARDYKVNVRRCGFPRVVGFSRSVGFYRSIGFPELQVS